MRLLKTILLSLLALAQVAFCAEDYYKVRSCSKSYVFPSLSLSLSLPQPVHSLLTRSVSRS